MGEIIKTKKFDKSLFIMCLVGAAAGFLIAEVLYSSVMTEWLPILKVGTYIALIVLCVCLAALICEGITGNLREDSWTGKQIGLGVLILVLAAVVFFGLGALFQFIYGLGLNMEKKGEVQDYIILIDNSASTLKTDPDNERFSAVVSLVETLESTQNIMVKVFDEEVQGTFPGTGSPMVPAGPDTAKNLQQFFDGIPEGGNTNVHVVLMEALDEYTPAGRECAVLLLSDGESNVDVNEVSKKFKEKDLPVYCVSFSGAGFSGSRLLSKIADQTGGFFYEIDELSNLSTVVETMINAKEERVLLEKVPGSIRNDTLHRILRVVFITILGCLLGVAVSLVVDNSLVMTAGMPIHAAGSFLAGLVTEFGWAFLPGKIVRLLMALLISIIAVSYMKQQMAFSEDFGGGTETGRGSGKRKAANPKDLNKKKGKPDDSKSLV